jgi:hypothetical protein
MFRVGWQPAFGKLRPLASPSLQRRCDGACPEIASAAASKIEALKPLARIKLEKR